MQALTASAENLRLDGTRATEALAVPSFEAEWFHVACRLRRCECRVFGTLAVGAGVDLAAVTWRLASALAECASGSVALVLPAAAELRDLPPRELPRRELPQSALTTAQAHVEHLRAWPPSVAALDECLARLAREHAHVVVVLPDDDVAGAHIGARELLDGIVLVARLGQVAESELLSENHRSNARHLGVVLLES
jgi:hypothetical protein